LSDILAGAGVLIAAGASAAAILLPAGRARSAAMLVAIALFPILILGDQWHTTQIVDLRDSNARIAALALIGIVAVGTLAYLFRRWPILMPLAIIAALPFRIPLHAGGDTANLLVPLYLVIAGGVVAASLRDWALPPRRGIDRVSCVLAAVVVLYAVQTLYSEDFSKGLQNVCFFLVPFTVAFALLQDVKWDAKLLKLVLWVVAAEALAFVVVGSVEYASRSLFWNDAIIRSNDFHTYFRVNSVFWDPNIYGRYLALVLVIVTTALLWTKDRRNFWLLAGTILVLWIGLAQTFSQSSFIALLAGLAVLAAIRWSGRWTLAAVALGVVGAVLVIVLAGGSGRITPGQINKDLSGRGNLVSGGVDLFGERPLWGYGSGSFQTAYAARRDNKDLPVSVSHTEPVTVAAEQGLIGLVFYVALIVVALWTMLSAVRGPPVGGVDGVSENGASLPRPQDTPSTPLAPRAAVLATFVALLVHTMAYAGFYEDPITWVLMAVGAALASTPYVAPESATVRDPA
jgi:O-antigen ligase